MESAIKVMFANDYYPGGMLQPGRSFSSSSYKYGFNGMLKDDEVKGSGNSYDFGARMYDPRIGRWFAVDPLAARYTSLSPYNFVGNNPILFVDPNGKENIIYLVMLPSSETSLSDVDMNDVITEINKRFTDLGLKTRAVLYDIETQGAFNPLNLDETDSFALFGSVSEINEEIKGVGGDGFDDVRDAAVGWPGGSNDPEISAVGKDGRYRLGVKIPDKMEKGILIDAKAMTSSPLTESTIDAIVITVLHGAGHNAGNYLHVGDPLKVSANEVRDYIGENGFDAALSKENNEHYIGSMEKFFGKNKAVDNYNTNKKDTENKSNTYDADGN